MGLDWIVLQGIKRCVHVMRLAWITLQQIGH